MFRAPAVELTIWLNQFRAGQITKSDARNACETITETELLLLENEIVNWSHFLETLSLAQVIFGELFTCVLPTPGFTLGLPQEVFISYKVDSGIVVLGPRHLLGQDVEGNWVVHEIPNNVGQVDLVASRRELMDLVAAAESDLAALHLMGDRSAIDEQLFKLRPIHLPPSLPTKAKQDLELAERIWLVTAYAQTESTAVASPSNDQRRIKLLAELNRASLNLLAAASSVS